MAQIIIIDDSRTTLMHLTNILKEGGHQVLAAQDGEAGLKLIADNAPNCVICDLLMPGISGMEILEQVKEKYPELPVIISTADIQEATRKQCFDLGALTLVNKPARKEAINAAVEQALAGD
ncbi:MAG: response regulator [Desulfuromonadales bacterium]|nr:response regulator [Desulfuromonadales bacterium]